MVNHIRYLLGMKFETEGPEKEFSPKLSGVLMSSATWLCELLSDDKYDVFCDESVFFNEWVVKSCSSILSSISFKNLILATISLDSLP